MFLNNAEVAKYYSQSPSDFIFYFVFIAFRIVYLISLKNKHQFSFSSQRIQFFTWKSDVHFFSFNFFPVKLRKSWDKKWLCRVLPETRLLLERAKFKSLVTSSYGPLSSLLQKVSNLYYHPKSSSSIKHVYKVTNLNVTKDT